MNLQTASDPVLVACKAWGQNKLTLLAIAPESNHGRMEVERAVSAAGKGALCARIAVVPEIYDDAPDGDVLRFAAVSWSPRSPKRLRLESILFRSLFRTQRWAESGVIVASERRVFTLEALADSQPLI